MSFTSQHISRTRMIHLVAASERVFPLFEPIGEKAWAEGWEPTLLFPDSGAAEEGTIFVTQHPGEADTIWTITTYDLAHCHLTYLRVTPGSRVGFVDAQCQDAPDGTTWASVTYTLTALSEAGNEHLARFTEAYYTDFMAAWEQAMNYYLTHGQRLHHH